MLFEADESITGTERCERVLSSPAGVQNHSEWSENCEQMALFHLDRPDLATSQHLLQCAELRLKGARHAPLEEIKEREVSLALTWAKWYIRQLAESCDEKRRPGSYKPPARVLPESLRQEPRRRHFGLTQRLTWTHLQSQWNVIEERFVMSAPLIRGSAYHVC